MKITTGKILSLVLVSSIVFALTGCDKFTIRSKNGSDIKGVGVAYEAKLTEQDITPFSNDFTDGMNRYGFEVLRDLYADENIAVSPASLELALLMTAQGAIDETREEMLEALCMSGISDEEILESAAQLMWRTNINGMEAANSLWPQKDYGFNQDYLDICADDFMADILTVDYKKDAGGATDSINEWVDEKTHGKIPEVLSQPLSENTRLVLVNALYYLGNWAEPFSADNTYDETFYGTSSQSEVPFMHEKRAVLYASGSTYQLISIPFSGDSGDEGPFAMAFILPRPDVSIEDVIKELNEDGFAEIIEDAGGEDVVISLPKFEFEYGTSVTGLMEKRGMTEAFGQDAEFDSMTGGENDLFISDIIHKTYIKVDEEGAEAAAVTAVLMDVTAMPNEPEQETVFCADRPFIFAIYDTTDNAVLFTGITANL
jgi:serpin B